MLAILCFKWLNKNIQEAVNSKETKITINKINNLKLFSGLLKIKSPMCKRKIQYVESMHVTM